MTEPISRGPLNAPFPRTGKRGVPQQFPRKLYKMLQSESKNPTSLNGSSPSNEISLIASTKNTDIIISPSVSCCSWSDSGKAFRISDINQFSAIILPKYFRTSKFSSFQRNLNLYGFAKTRRGADANMYAHPAFLRDQPDMLSQLTKCKGSSIKNKKNDHKKLRNRNKKCNRLFKGITIKSSTDHTKKTKVAINDVNNATTSTSTITSTDNTSSRCLHKSDVVIATPKRTQGEHMLPRQVSTSSLRDKVLVYGDIEQKSRQDIVHRKYNTTTQGHLYSSPNATRNIISRTSSMSSNYRLNESNISFQRNEVFDKLDGNNYNQDKLGLLATVVKLLSD